MEVTGLVHFLGQEQQVSAAFKKREIVVKSDEQYPQFISVNFVQDKCDLLNGYSVGQSVKVSVNLRGREWINPQGETKYFNDIQGWRIEKFDINNVEVNNATVVNEPKPVVQDDLPF